MMCPRVVWLELDRAFVFAHRSGQIDFTKKEHFAEREMRFGEIRIEAESFEGRLFRFRRSIASVRAGVKGGQNIGTRETRVNPRIIRIASDRLFVTGDCFWNVVSGTLFP